MALVAGIVLAIVVLDGPWRALAVVAGGAVELGEAWLWWRWSRGRQPVVGVETLIGAVGEMTGDGRVLVRGERWQARGDAVAGDRVRVQAVDGLVLSVERL